MPERNTWLRIKNMNGMFRTLSSALEALGSAVPSSLAALIWIGFKIGPEMITPLLLAMFCATVDPH